MQNFHFPSFILILLTVLPSFKSLQPYLHTDLDYSTSPIDFANLIVVESNIVFNFLKFLEECETNLCSTEFEGIKEYVHDFESTLLKDVDLQLDLFKMLYNQSIIDTHGLGAYATKHPFKIYRTIRRFVKYLPILINSTLNGEMVKGIENVNRFQPFPKQVDLETAITNVLRLNQIFKLPFTDFLKGKVGRIQSKCGLTSEHLEEMGNIAVKCKFYSQAVDAFAIGLWNAVKQSKNVSGSGNNTSDAMIETVGKVRLSELYASLQDAIKQHDEKIQGSIEIEDIQTDSGPLFFDNLLHNISHENFKYRIPVRLETVLPIANYEENDVRLDVIKNGYIFEQLCRGQELRTAKDKARLKCYLSSKTHPEFILKPLRIEVHHEDPLLLQYHDVLSEEEIENYKNEVRGELRMSRTIREEVGVLSRHRTSSNAWIEDYFHGKFKPLLHRIGRILNLKTVKATGSENMQIAAYSPGGHYTPHTDAVFEEEILDKLDPSEFLRGDRIMTFMIYLSDVEEGGGTVFPYLKTVVQPKKGSAMAWYNLHPDGTIDRRTLHGGCSVVYGVKWIANKWIRNDDQMFLMPCPAHKPIPISWPLGRHVHFNFVNNL